MSVLPMRTGAAAASGYPPQRCLPAYLADGDRKGHIGTDPARAVMAVCKRHRVGLADLNERFAGGFVDPKSQDSVSTTSISIEQYSDKHYKQYSPKAVYTDKRVPLAINPPCFNCDTVGFPYFCPFSLALSLPVQNRPRVVPDGTARGFPCLPAQKNRFFLV